MRIWLGIGLASLTCLGQADSTGVAAVRGLISRIAPGHANGFVLEAIGSGAGSDVFEIDSRGGKVVLRGNNGVSLASALNWYLKYDCHCQLSWGGDQLRLPARLPLPRKERHVSPYQFRYDFNYCTFNYSMSWWDWKRWQREIDFMALNGINMPLALTGEESIWQRVYKRMGFSDSELAKFFCGPAYFSWFWMGNLDAWGGPLPQSWFDSHLKLQKQILKREREFGMTPVLPAFTGHVPPNFLAKFPQAKAKKVNWGADFAPTLVLDPTDPLFPKIGKAFLEEQQKEYGTDHYYSSDTFNENNPPTDDPAYLSSVAKGIYDTMAEVDPKAAWVMQGWIFVNDPQFWKDPQIEALLTAVPQGRLIVLDLYSDVMPQWKRAKSYYGQPWIWCMLHNFGGRMNLFGSLQNIAKAPIDTLHDPSSGHMKGIGFTPEAIENNPVIYELMAEHAWRNAPVTVKDWIQEYAWRRYGKKDSRVSEAWAILAEKIYNDHSGGDNADTSIVAARPTLGGRGNWVGTNRNYDPRDLVHAWELMVDAAPSFRGVDTYEYDLVDVTRQVLAILADMRQQGFADVIASRDAAKVREARDGFIGLIHDWDKVMGTRKEFLLGKWNADARRWSVNRTEADLMERNARDLVTLWGDKNSPLHEYSTREWSGLLSGFYAPRWSAYFDQILKDMASGRKPDAKAFESRIRDWEWAWVNSTKPYPSSPSGSSVDEALRVFRKYGQEARTVFPPPPARGLEVGAKATASSVQAGHEASSVVDGVISPGSSWWGTPCPQWVQIELAQPAHVRVIHVWPYWGDGRSYQYTVEVSLDGEHWTKVADKSRNSTPSTQRGDRFEISPMTVKFVRVNVLHNSANEAAHISEIRVYP